MKRILVINPNTTVAVTDMVLAACRNAGAGAVWEGATARFGAAYIACEAAYAMASHAVLDAYAAHYSGQDAVLIACFGDPGLLALREISAVPVLGLAQSSFNAAAARGPFAVVTGGSAWGPMLQRFARTHALETHLVGIYTVELTGAQIAAAPDRAMDELAEACGLGRRDGAKNILLGGAALTGLGVALQARVGLPVLDNVLLGAEAALAAAREGGAPALRAGRIATPTTAIAAELARLLA